MKKVLIILSLFIVSYIQAATLSTSQKIYSPTDGGIKVQFKDIIGKKQNWIAIYPANSDNSWSNVVQWKWTGDKTSGKMEFNTLQNGKYEVRAFYNNSFKLEAKIAFEVKGEDPRAPKLTTSKTQYSITEKITVNFENMLGNKDWIGIYPAESTNAWKNVIDWAWTDDKKNGQLSFDSLAVGNYEIRAFFKNSFRLEQKVAFKINTHTNNPPIVKTLKETYTPSENIIVDFKNMNNQNKDWIGIYPSHSNNDWANVIDWKWTNNKSSGQLTFSKKLPTGKYTVKAFYNNSFKDENHFDFEVKDSVLERAKTCLDGKNNESNQVLCFNEQDEDIVYVIDTTFEEYKVYKVNLAIEGVELTTTIDRAYAQQADAIFVPLANTNLIAIHTFYDLGDPVDTTRFYHQGKDLQLEFTFSGKANTQKIEGKYKTIQHGKKLEITYKQFNHDTNYWQPFKDIYDISNPSNLHLVSHTKI